MIKLKTNIKCAGCIEAITPKLDALPNSEWKVDLDDPQKKLTVTGNATEAQVKAALKAAGYQGEAI
ncbi:heavy metal transport/detoxification protein [Echinicola soli]|uniref:Heavy metal transport/detoxification protein n=1 Tax=Echinicola soli TaxID=2591634 RepID=A0A514CG81_9BACT|nr:cation transporter [Echinicola soli]QDH78831.1 heavy metal transport/detoxification protein [Echinicola soli]